MPKEIVIARGVSKKFCRDLRRSMWYGLRDIGSELIGLDRSANGALRPLEFWALRDVTFDLERGECIALIGHNGAGKTTLLRILNGLIKPDSGDVEIKGRVGALIALGSGFHPLLSGRENIFVSGMILGLSKREVIAAVDRIVDFSGLGDSIDTPVQTYSSGMIVRLGFSIAAACRPEVLLLDEVLAVGDMEFQAKCLNAISGFKKEGVALILVSHNIHHLRRYSDKVLWLNHGSQEYLGSTDEGLDRYVRAYGQSASFDELDMENVVGDGDLRISNLEVVSDLGHAIESLSPRAPFRLRISYECRVSSPESFVVDLLVRDREGILLQASSDMYSEQFLPEASQGTIEVHFPSLPSSSSELRFSVALLGAQSKCIHDWKKGLSIPVSGAPPSAGRIALDLEWVHDSTEPRTRSR